MTITAEPTRRTSRLRHLSWYTPPTTTTRPAATPPIVPAAGPRSARQQQRQLAAQLRAHGHTWADIAHQIAARYAVNMRVACRLGHGYSQTTVIDRWNHTWPDDPKTFKNLSYWEQWPATTGYAPSLRVLQRLAHLYDCRVADLVSDIPTEAATTVHAEAVTR